MSFKKKIPDAKRWFKKRLYRKKTSSDLDVIVRSVGGAGTTTLIKYLSKYKNLNCAHDRDGFKHARKLILPKRQKQILILSDPKDIYKSLTRRSYLIANCFKLGFITYFINSESLFLYECKQIQEMWLSEMKNKEHTLILHYDELFESAEEIQEYLKIPGSEFKHNFPARKKRNS